MCSTKKIVSRTHIKSNKQKQTKANKNKLKINHMSQCAATPQLSPSQHFFFGIHLWPLGGT